MAISSVQIVGPQDKTKTSASKQGGSKMGSAIGTVAGGVIGGISGGPPGAIAGAAGGASLGGMIGEMAAPSRQGETAITRRLQAPGPQIVHSEQSNQLKQSLMALQQQPPEIQAQYQAPLVTAYMQSVAKDNPKTGMA